jgi:hypothetical protein
VYLNITTECDIVVIILLGSSRCIRDIIVVVIIFVVITAIGTIFPIACSITFVVSFIYC